MLVLVIFQRMLGFVFADPLANPETFLLWFASPAMIFIAAGGMAGRELNRVARENIDRRPLFTSETAS
jgi:hypothetical protein